MENIEEGGALKDAELDLAKAERELAAAATKVADAEHDIQAAERAIEKEARRREFKVEVIYNGVKRPFEVRLEDLVKTLLDKALNVFGPIPNPHTLSLFASGGAELADNVTIEAAGVRPDEVLLLRPSQVKGG